MTTHNFDKFLAACRNLKVLVLGDLMIDQYLWGSIDRISPEAPVPVVDVTGRERRLGGAANAALNIRALGAEPILCGVTGTDRNGSDLMDLAEEIGFDNRMIFQFPSRKTTVKTRIICSDQHVLRVDDEDRSPLESNEMSQVLDKLFDRMTEFDAIIFSDYDKGLLDETLIQMTIVYAAQHNIPVMVDPKFNNFQYYGDCTLFKPNLKELSEGTGRRLDKRDLPGIAKAVKLLQESMPHQKTLVTLSENGMLLIDENGKYTHIPAHKRSIIDVSGAGDTVISVASLAFAAGFDPLQAAEFANLAGGLVCEEVGVVPIKVERLKEEVQRLVLGKKSR